MTVADNINMLIERHLLQLDERESILRRILAVLQRQRVAWLQRNSNAEARFATDKTFENRQRIYTANLQVQVTDAFIASVESELRAIDDAREPMETSRILIRLIGQKSDDTTERMLREMETAIKRQADKSDALHDEAIKKLKEQLDSMTKRVKDLEGGKKGE